MKIIIEFKDCMPVKIDNTDIKDLFDQLKNEWVMVYPIEKEIDEKKEVNPNEVMAKNADDLISFSPVKIYKEIPNTGKALIFRSEDVKRVYQKD